MKYRIKPVLNAGIIIFHVRLGKNLKPVFVSEYRWQAEAWIKEHENAK